MASMIITADGIFNPVNQRNQVPYLSQELFREAMEDIRACLSRLAAYEEDQFFKTAEYAYQHNQQKRPAEMPESQERAADT